MSDLSPEDRYQLRKAQMDADKKSLEAQKAQQDLERLVLELEHRYGLLAEGRSIDPRTTTVQGMSPARRGNGKDTVEALAVAVPDEAAS
jgi:hypothetical protein